MKKNSTFTAILALTVLITANCGAVGDNSKADNLKAPLIDTIPPALSILGNNPEEISMGTVYVDMGATAVDDVDGNITDKIITTGLPIKTDILGTYDIKYTVSDEAGNQADATRKVFVIDRPPVISLIGGYTVEVYVGEEYTDAGVTANDDIDGDITNNVVTSGLPIDTNDPGIYIVTYSVTDTAGNSTSISRRVYVIDQTTPQATYLEIWPERILDPAYSGSVTLNFTFQAHVDSAEVLLTPPNCYPQNCSVGIRIPLTQVGDYMWTGDFDNPDLFANYIEGEPQSFIGYCDIYNGSTRTTRYNLLLPVRSNIMPDADRTLLSADMQITDHVLNIRHDTILTGESYNTLQDIWIEIHSKSDPIIGQCDFYALVGQVDAFVVPLRAGDIFYLPRAGTTDLASSQILRFIGNKLGLPYSNHPLINGWGLGNAANAIMGWGGNLQFPFRIEISDIPGATKLIRYEAVKEYNDLELYKIGALQAGEVEPILQFTDQVSARNWMYNPYSIPSCGYNCQLLDISSEYVAIEDIIASDGPTPQAVKTDFTLATLVLSHGRLLTPNELAYFEYMAARGEGTSTVSIWEGFYNYYGKPFNAATRGLMTLSTRITE